jgi:hypothetical protein
MSNASQRRTSRPAVPAFPPACRVSLAARTPTWRMCKKANYLLPFGLLGTWGSEAFGSLGTWGSEAFGSLGTWGSEAFGSLGTWGSEEFGSLGTWGSEEFGSLGTWGSEAFGSLGTWGSEEFGSLGTWGIVPPPWRLTLAADTTRGARRAMQSLKNNISVKRVK